MPLVFVEWIEGRTVDQKRRLAKAITEAMADIGKVKPEAIQVVFHDVPRDNWSQAGALMSDAAPAPR